MTAANGLESSQEEGDDSNDADDADDADDDYYHYYCDALDQKAGNSTTLHVLYFFSFGLMHQWCSSFGLRTTRHNDKDDHLRSIEFSSMHKQTNKQTDEQIDKQNWTEGREE